MRLFLDTGKPPVAAGKKVFDSPPIWSLYQDDGRSFFRIYGDMRVLGQTLVVTPGKRETRLYFDSRRGPHNPFFGPAMELLVIQYLAGGRGVILHACGVVEGDAGVALVGESGAGKSTLAQLWNRCEDAEVVSDDRLIVRDREGRFWIYGTPWHGKAHFASDRSAPLRALFFLKQAGANDVRPLTAAASVRRLLAASFPPFWDAAGMRFALDFFSRLTAAVACYELAFVPDTTAVEFAADALRRTAH